jgi:hypothetical protein
MNPTLLHTCWGRSIHLENDYNEGEFSYIPAPHGQLFIVHQLRQFFDSTGGTTFGQLHWRFLFLALFPFLRQLLASGTFENSSH